ncbi:MAG: MFS transporter [Nitrospirae bacterium]|nr:MAG: MFS transporter [Nitrospirota bacterium]
MKSRLPRNVWVTGWVSFFMDVSSEMVYPLVPLFLSSTLGVSKSVVGVIEGIAEASASLLKLFSGMLADRFGKNKLLMGIGYATSVVSRPLLALATGWGMVLTARFTDRVGKGIRTAPRDAIIAGSAPPERWGLAFGFHRALDTAGAIVGPAVALLILAVWAADYRLVFWLSIIPGMLAVALIVLFISADGRSSKTRPPFSWSFGGFDRSFQGFLLVIGLFSLGNFSHAFLILKAEQVGMSPALISGVYLVFNAVYALVSIPGGMLADRFGKRRMIVGGFGLFAGVYAGFALATAPWQIAALFALHGGYMGLTDGVQRAYLATLVPEGQKATGFGLFHLVVGAAILPASLIAGLLWDHVGPVAPFWFGAGLAILAATTFVSLSRRRRAPS